MSNVRKMIGRNGSEKLTIIVIFIVAEDCASIKPRKIVDYFEDKMLTFIKLLQKLGHRACGVDSIFDSCIEDIKQSVWFWLYVS